jgi:4-amino-4-deoxy-L-arabinose transferase-like glycosyltransferase
VEVSLVTDAKVGPGLAAWLLFAVAGMAFLWQAVRVVAEPHLLNYTEGISLYSALRVLEGQSLYLPIQEPPFVYLAYPPIYPLLTAAVVSFTGPSLLGLRLVSVVCEALLCGLLFGWVRRETRDARAALFSASVLLALFASFRFHALARLDPVHALWTLAAVGVSLAALRRPRTGTLILAAGIWLLSLLTKPTGAVMLAGVGALALGATRRRESGGTPVLACLTVSAALYAAILAALTWRTAGEFWSHTITYQGLSGWYAKPYVLWEFFVSYAPFLLVSLPCMLLVRGHGRSRTLTALSLFWFGISSMKFGADLNYAFEPFFFLSVCLGLGSHQLSQALERSAASRRTLAFGVQAAIVLVLLLGGTPQSELFEPQARRDRERLGAFVKASPGPVLSEEPCFALLGGRGVVLSDPFQYSVLAARGKFDPEPLRGMLRDGRIPLVLAGERLRRMPGVAEALERSYRRTFITETKLAQTHWEVWQRAPDNAGPGDRPPASAARVP